MNILTTDYECTTSNKGNPFDKNNFAVCLAYKYNDDAACNSFDPQETVDGWNEQDFLHVFFNAKFDLHWHRKHNYRPTRIWCCQLAEFYLRGQTLRFPSLGGVAADRGLGQKIDVIEREYWSKGINTHLIPKEILSEYACQDVNLTYQIFIQQLNELRQNPRLYALFKLACQDLLILEDMEWNGLRFDEKLCSSRAIEIREKLDEIDKTLKSVYQDVNINFNSRDQLSAFLYGGIITELDKESIGIFKTGQRMGEVKYKNVEKQIHLPRLIEPLKNSEMQKEGVYATDEGTLRKLKGKMAKKYVPLLLERSQLEKLVGTYYEGIPELVKQMNWEEGYVHGQFNQVVASTGRLSASKPNQQNFASEMEDVFTTRYEEST